MPEEQKKASSNQPSGGTMQASKRPARRSELKKIKDELLTLARRIEKLEKEEQAA